MTLSQFDKNISNLLDDWYDIAIYDTKSILKISLTTAFLSQSFIKKSLLGKKILSLLSYRNSNNILWTLKKSAWFILWLLKWLLYIQSIKKKKIIIAAIGSNLNSTSEYFKQLSSFALKNNCVVILLNLVESILILKDRQIVYFPRFMYLGKNYFVDELNNKTLDEIINEFEKIAKINGLDVTIEKKIISKEFYALIKDFNSFNYLIKSSLSKSQILALIQDYDYTYNKFIYCQLSKLNGIKSILIDSSFLIYSHLYKKVFSDYHLVWGEYKKDYLFKNNIIDVSRIIVTGKPVASRLTKTITNTSKSIWLYISQAYSDPALFISGRSFNYLKMNIDKLSEYQRMNHPEDKLFLKLHPADNPLDFDIKVQKSNSINLINLIESARIIFVEDTTLLFELVYRGYPVVYILDAFGNDNIGLVNQGLVPGVDFRGNFNDIIKAELSGKIKVDLKISNSFFEYYFGKYDDKDFEKIVSDILLKNEKK